MKKCFAMMLAAAILTACACALAEGGITADAAKEIALNHAGVAADQAHYTRVKQGMDDGRPEWEVDFFAGDTEYEFDIDATTGRITDFDTERLTRDYAAEKVTEDEAKQIALAQAGLDAGDVRFTKVKPDEDDGRMVLEVEFVAGGMEYEFNIDAATAVVVKMDIDRDD